MRGAGGVCHVLTLQRGQARGAGLSAGVCHSKPHRRQVRGIVGTAFDVADAFGGCRAAYNALTRTARAVRSAALKVACVSAFGMLMSGIIP